MFYVSNVSDVLLDSFFKYYNKWVTTRKNMQSHDQEKRKNSTIITNAGAHTLTDDKIIVYLVRIM